MHNKFMGINYHYHYIKYSQDSSVQFIGNYFYFIHSFIHLSSTRSFVISFIYPFNYSFIHYLIHLSIHSLIFRYFIHSINQSFIHLLHSFIHSFIHGESTLRTSDIENIKLTACQTLWYSWISFSSTINIVVRFLLLPSSDSLQSFKEVIFFLLE